MSKDIRNILQRLTKRKEYKLRVEGKSMIPFLYPSDLLTLKKTSFSSVKVNDIVLVNNKKDYLIHRVIYKSRNYLITKGDNNAKPEGKIKPKGVLAKLIKVKRKNKVFNHEQLYLIQSTLYFSKILEVKKAMEKQGIDFVFLKGLPLHLYIEKSAPRRIYADCDILLKKEDKHKAHKILRKIGFKKRDTAFTHAHKFFKNKDTEIVYTKKVNGFPVVFDVHFEPGFLMNQLGSLNPLYPQKLIDRMTDKFLQKKRNVKIKNNYFPILSSANLIVYLSLHFFHHNYRGVYMLDFLDKVIRRESMKKGLDTEIITIVKEYKLSNFVYPVFILLNKYFDTPLSGKITQKLNIKNKKDKYIRKKIISKSIFESEDRLSSGINRFRNIFLLAEENIFKKILILFSPAFLFNLFWSAHQSFFSKLRLFFFQSVYSKKD